MVERTTERGRTRRSPEGRLIPLAKLVLDPPLKLPDSYVEALSVAQPKMVGKGRLEERQTPLAKAMAEGVPADGSWYLAAICYSRGEATALSSHISRGGYGGGVQVACGPIPNKNKRGSGREHAVLLRRTPTGRKRGSARK